MFTRKQLKALLERKEELDIEKAKLKQDKSEKDQQKKKEDKMIKEQNKLCEQRKREYEERQLLRFGALIDLDALEYQDHLQLCKNSSISSKRQKSSAESD